METARATAAARMRDAKGAAAASLEAMASAAAAAAGPEGAAAPLEVLLRSDDDRVAALTAALRAAEAEAAARSEQLEALELLQDTVVVELAGEGGASDPAARGGSRTVLPYSPGAEGAGANDGRVAARLRELRELLGPERVRALLAGGGGGGSGDEGARVRAPRSSAPASASPPSDR